MSTSTIQPDESASAREIVNERLLDTPHALVFQAFAEPEHLARWWGPEGFTNTFSEFDLRAGGHWRFVMHGPDGTDYPNHSVFDEVSPERIVFRHLDEEHQFQMTIQLAAEGEQTRVTWRMLHPTAEKCERVRAFVIPANEQNLDRLQAELALMVTKPFVLSRLFDATPERIWQAWTDREQLAKWFGPKGVTLTIRTLDLRPGGTFHYCMRLPDGLEMWGKWIYQEVAAPSRLATLFTFSDAEGGITRHPMSASWPLTSHSLATFEARDGKTLLTIEWRPVNPTAGERETFDSSHDGMRQGWSGTLDQLAEFLAKP